MSEGKGGWIANLHTFSSPMAQNFWIAIFAWTVCFVATIAISLVTRPRVQSELTGLVYGLTKMPRQRRGKLVQTARAGGDSGGRAGDFFEYLVCLICST